MAETWDNLLEELIDETEFKTSVEENGFYKTDVSLEIFAKNYNFDPSQNTATYLSLDFWSQQSKILRKKNQISHCPNTEYFATNYPSQARFYCSRKTAAMIMKF